MADTPHHPERQEDAQMEGERGSRASWRTYLFVGIGLVVVLLFVVLHLTGAVGPDGH